MERTPKSVAMMACRRLLQPVVRLLLLGGVTWKEFAEVSKTVFVQVATDEFGIRGRPTNMAKVAILTGINRREVARQRQLVDEQSPEEPVYLNAAQRLLSGWHQDSDYLDPAGLPRLLSVEGTAPSFADLCARYAGDMPASALLKELRAVGAVAAEGEGLVSARSRIYIPLPMDPDKVLRAGSVLQDVGTTVVHDLTCSQGVPLRFERRAENDAMDPALLPAFREFVEREGQAFLERVDDWLTRHEATQRNGAELAPIRLGVGLYHIQSGTEQENSR